MKDLKVKDLIVKLQAVKDQNATVVVTTSNFEQGQNKVPATSLFEFKGELKSESFRDAFDGGNYNKDVVCYDEKGKTTFIQIT